MDFIGREQELAFLNLQYELEHPLTIVTGRRRVGKSALILEFLKDKNSLYFEVDRETGSAILRSFSNKVSETIGRPIGEFRSWSDAIHAYMELSPRGRKVLVIDEFQYIAMSDKEFTKGFQGIWDNYLSKEDVMVILCGSYLTMMRKLTLEYNSPLYGRNTGDLRLMPLPFGVTGHRNDYRRAVEEYSVTGGVPHYMSLMNPGQTVIENIERLTMDLGAPLLNEPAYLLSEEFRDPSSYNTYLRVISEGNRKADRITSAVQSPSSTVLPYLRNLIDTGMLERRVPITEGDEGHSRNGIYVISDNFMALWYRFVYPYRNRISRMEPDSAKADLRAHFVESHVSFVFEDICRSELREYLRSRDIFASYGSYWEGNIEIDVVAKDDVNHVLYVGECKYRTNPIGPDVLNALRSKCMKVRPFEKYRVVHCLFSVSGYTDEAVANASLDGSILFDCGVPMNESSATSYDSSE